MLGIPGITPEVIAVAIVTAVIGAIATFLFRDSLNRLLDWIRGRSKSKSRWYRKSTDNLARLSNIGSTMQAESDIKEEHLDRIYDLSEDFIAHASSRPNRVAKDVHREVVSIAKYSGFIGPILRELNEADTMAEAMETLMEFRRRMRIHNQSLDEVYSKVPDSDIEKLFMRLGDTYLRTIFQSRNQRQLTVNLIAALEIDLSSINDEDQLFEELGNLNYEDFVGLPWEAIFGPVDGHSQQKFVKGITFDFVSVYLVEIPEEVIGKINERS